MFVVSVGGLSILNALAGAYSENLPILVVSGSPPSTEECGERLLHHTMGIPEMHRPLGCMEALLGNVHVVKHANSAGKIIDHAICECLLKRKPMYLQIPSDMAHRRISEPAPMGSLPHSRFVSDLTAMISAADEILRLLDGASTPMVIAGRGLATSKAAEQCERLVTALDCATAITPDAKVH